MKTAIMFGILNTIVAGKRVSAELLAQKYEISKRTVYRYVDTLCASGVPIYSTVGRYGGFGITESYKIHASYFTAEEYNRLLPAVASFDIQDEVTRSVTDKLSGLSNAVERQFVLKSEQLVVDTPTTEAIQAKLLLLTRAVSQRKICNVIYHDRKGEGTKRSLKPLSLLLREGIWYVYAFCQLRNDFRFFKISRIVSLDVTEEIFAPVEFKLETDAEFGISLAEKTDVSFTLSSSVLSAVEEWLGVDAVKPLPGSTDYIAYAKLPFDDWLIYRLLSFGKDIKILESGALKKAVKKALLSALENYT